MDKKDQLALSEWKLHDSSAELRNEKRVLKESTITSVTNCEYPETSLSEYSCTVKVPRFNGARDDDFHLWCLRMKTTLIVKKGASTLLKKDVSLDITEKALFLITCALGDKPLPAVQHCTTTRAGWDKVGTRYAGKTLINELRVLSIVWNITLKIENRKVITVLKLRPNSLYCRPWMILFRSQCRSRYSYPLYQTLRNTLQ